MAQNIPYVGANAAQLIANKVKSLLNFANLSGTATTAQIPDLSTDKLTSGTLGLDRGGTGGANAASARTSLDVYSKSEVDSLVGGGGGGGSASFLGTCDTAASTSEKTVACSDFTSDSDVAGATIYVKFANANTASSVALNVNNTGAITVKTTDGSTNCAYMWSAGEVVQFIFDGTFWIAVNNGIATTSYYGETKLNDSYTSTDSTTAATPNAVYYGLATREKKYTKTTMNLSSSSWTGSGPYYYDLSGSYSSSSYDLEVDLNWDSASSTQQAAWLAAQITGSYSYNRLCARGTKPTTTIPIVLKITNRT